MERAPVEAGATAAAEKEKEEKQKKKEECERRMGRRREEEKSWARVFDFFWFFWSLGREKIRKKDMKSSPEKTNFRGRRRPVF
jgi:hypothetical protein